MIRQTCPGCEVSSFEVLVSEPYIAPNLLKYMREYYLRSEQEVRHWLSDALFEVRECRNCGVCWQVFYPDPPLAAELYDRWINGPKSRDWDLKRPSINGYSPILQEVVALSRHVEKQQGIPLPAIKVLDYGMGWGSWLRIARAFGLDAYGYEVSSERIAHASALGIPCLGANELDDHRFHIINMEQVLEHVPDPSSLLEGLLPRLADGGLLKISVPNGSGVAASLRGVGATALVHSKFTAIRPLEHVNSFTPGSLRHLADRHGLRVLRVPVLRQFSFIDAGSLSGFARSIGRPLVRGVLGLGTSVILSR